MITLDVNNELILQIMKNTLHIILAATISLSATSTLSYAGNESGKDSARYYKSHPDKFNSKAVDVDCTHVTRINGANQLDKIVFFAAHTKDDDNRTRGGSIVVAVAAEKADSFIRKFGTTLDRNRGSSERINSTRLRGIFHMLDNGSVYIDYSDVHEVITKNLKNAKIAIGRGNKNSAKNNKKQ